MASVCRACEGRVVSGDDSPSLVKHSVGCVQSSDPEKQLDKYGHLCSYSLKGQRGVEVNKLRINRIYDIMFAMIIFNNICQISLSLKQPTHTPQSFHLEVFITAQMLGEPKIWGAPDSHKQLNKPFSNL